jgi:hypothetical protein
LLVHAYYNCEIAVRAVNQYNLQVVVMKIVAVVVLLLLWACVCCGPVTYSSFLTRLSPNKRYQQSSLLEELDHSVPVRVDLCSIQ